MEGSSKVVDITTVIAREQAVGIVSTELAVDMAGSKEHIINAADIVATKIAIILKVATGTAAEAATRIVVEEVCT